MNICALLVYLLLVFAMYHIKLHRMGASIHDTYTYGHAHYRA